MKWYCPLPLWDKKDAFGPNSTVCQRFYNAKCAFFCFSWIWWFGGCTIGYFLFSNMLFFVQWLTDLSRNFVFVLLLSLSMFYVIAFVWYSPTVCSVVVLSTGITFPSWLILRIALIVCCRGGRLLAPWSPWRCRVYVLGCRLILCGM